MTTHTPITSIKGSGKVAAQKLKRLSLTTVMDVLNHFPVRYEDFRHITPISKLRGNSYACVKGKIRLIRSARSPRRHIGFTECLLEDQSGSIQCIWLNQPYIASSLKEGEQLTVAGKISVTKYGMQFINPTFEHATSSPIHTSRVVPLYALTSGLTHKMFRTLVKQSLPVAESITDPLPVDIRQRFHLMPLKEAYKTVHFPITLSHAHQARVRLALQELVNLLLAIERFKTKVAHFDAPAFPKISEDVHHTIKQLPFQLTKAQQETLDVCFKDAARTHPMNRMINGDVGSGKTIIAHVLAHNIALQGGLVVMLAPTEILAEQHFTSFLRDIHPAQYQAALFTRSFQRIGHTTESAESTRAKIKKGIAAKKIRYAIGTHALLQKSLALSDIALVIVDEQHRFGVEQRARLLLNEQKANSRTPHFLSLAATPIPRSLARILFGGTDVSLLSEKPAQRATTKTKILHENERQQAYAHIQQEIKNGHQAFVICPLIDESDTLEVKSAIKEHDVLQKQFPHLRIGLLHGKLSSLEKERVMKEFSDGDCDVLVATSVVEVGIDVPNATIMLIEGAERFGLAQLHQFRGRVGRSTFPSVCFIIQSEKTSTSERLKQFASHHNGFELAQFDLQNRGPGKILGTLQSGFVPFTLADATDTQLIQTAQAVVRELTGEKHAT